MLTVRWSSDRSEVCRDTRSLPPRPVLGKRRKLYPQRRNGDEASARQQVPHERKILPRREKCLKQSPSWWKQRCARARLHHEAQCVHGREFYALSSGRFGDVEKKKSIRKGKIPLWILRHLTGVIRKRTNYASDAQLSELFDLFASIIITFSKYI